MVGGLETYTYCMKMWMWLVALCCLSGAAVAQERTAGGSLQTESSWTALKAMIGKTDGDVSLLKTDVNAIKSCAAQKKMWDPAKGCVNIDTSLYDSMIACGDVGKVYDKSSNSCVSAGGNCSLKLVHQYVSKSGGHPIGRKTGSCPAGSYRLMTSSASVYCSNDASCTEQRFDCLAVTCQ